LKADGVPGGPATVPGEWNEAELASGGVRIWPNPAVRGDQIAFDLRTFPM